MQIDYATIRAFLSRDLMDLLIRAGLIVFVTILCVWIFAPFTGLLLWALVLAVALYPLHRGLASRLGGRQGWAATLLVIAGLLLTGVPTAMLGSSFAGHIHDAYTAFENDEMTIKQPSPGVAFIQALLLGAVLLAVGYQIFMESVEGGEVDETAVTGGPGSSAGELPAGE